MPGVLGVFMEEPKEANAPEPSPNAEDAPLVGDATVEVVRGERLLKGLDFALAELSAPNRLAGKYGRGESDLICSLLLLFELEVERESLVGLKHKWLANESF